MQRVNQTRAIRHGKRLDNLPRCLEGLCKYYPLGRNRNQRECNVLTCLAEQEFDFKICNSFRRLQSNESFFDCLKRAEEMLEEMLVEIMKENEGKSGKRCFSKDTREASVSKVNDFEN